MEQNKIRAKFICNLIVDQPNHQSKLIYMKPVTDGSEENKSFSRFTPIGNLEINVSYFTEAYYKFKNGEEYYLDFIKVEKKV